MKDLLYVLLALLGVKRASDEERIKRLRIRNNPRRSVVTEWCKTCKEEVWYEWDNDTEYIKCEQCGTPNETFTKEELEELKP